MIKLSTFYFRLLTRVSPFHFKLLSRVPPFNFKHSAFNFLSGPFIFVLFSFISALLVLWHLLLPGYVIALDMVWGPNMPLPPLAGISLLTAPLSLLIYALSHVIPAWVVQKMLLIGLVFCLFYVPLKWFPWQVSGRARMVASVFFAVNPFVYERLLAGQWRVVLGYILLAPFMYYVLRLFRDPHMGTSVRLVGVFALLLTVSPHIALIGGCASLIALMVSLADASRRSALRRHLTLHAVEMMAAIAAVIGVVVVLATYTPVQLQVIGEGDWRAFQTSAFEPVGVWLNVISMYGFWMERSASIHQFVLPHDAGVLWIITGVILAMIALWGAVSLLRRGATEAALLGILFLGSVFFSVGIVWQPALHIHQWLMNHVLLWNGFRDSEKWSALLVLVYMYWVGLGSDAMLGWVKRHMRSVSTTVFVFLLCLPVLYTPHELFGLNGQFKTTWYPRSWYAVDALLQKQEGCKAVFLPWHQYYSVEFNDRMLSASPAKVFFRCNVLTSAEADSPEVGAGVFDTDARYQSLSKAITAGSSDEVYAELKRQGVHFVIMSNDVVDEDWLRYEFLKSPYFEVRGSFEGIDVYRVL